MKRNGSHVGNPIGTSETVQFRGASYSDSPLRDTSAPCASGDKCMQSPPTRVEIRGEQCGHCLRVQREMRARLRGRAR
jgi:hypothetical protein